MINLSIELSTLQKSNNHPNSQDYQTLINYVLQKDMLNTYPCINNSLCLEEYIQMVYRWSFFY